MSDPRFLQAGFDKQLAHLIEECGEVIAAAGKTQRWGRDSSNPLLPEDQETNEQWLRREMGDLVAAWERLLKTMDGSPPPSVEPESPVVWRNAEYAGQVAICAGQPLFVALLAGTGCWYWQSGATGSTCATEAEAKAAAEIAARRGLK
jgi:NTP pyrophosphatase (non-canonical NTP hydrolase)